MITLLVIRSEILVLAAMFHGFILKGRIQIEFSLSVLNIRVQMISGLVSRPYVSDVWPAPVSQLYIFKYAVETQCLTVMKKRC